MVEKWRIRRVMRKERHESISFDPSSRDKPVTGLECPETRGEGQEHRERRKCKYIYICMYVSSASSIFHVYATLYTTFSTTSFLFLFLEIVRR